VSDLMRERASESERDMSRDVEDGGMCIPQEEFRRRVDATVSLLMEQLALLKNQLPVPGQYPASGDAEQFRVYFQREGLVRALETFEYSGVLRYFNQHTGEYELQTQ
jgi:hypothetical protein